MPPAVNITGQRYNKLVAIQQGNRGNDGRFKWLFECDCGNFIETRPADVYKGRTTSCGCVKRDILVVRNINHGKSDWPEYTVWCNMKARCNDPNATGYNAYGGRGISVCAAWTDSFEQFICDMGRRPSDSHSIDRIDNDGNYEAKNCKWSTRKEQDANRNTIQCRQNKFLSTL